MIHIYNSLTKQKEILKPINKSKIGLYVCGLTVYDDCHIGHGRLFIWFDVLTRYLQNSGYEVTYVRNITDIDDKIIKRSKELNIDYKQLTAKFIKSMHDDAKSLNIIPPDFEPLVTNNISEIISMVQNLIDKGYAYITKNSDVYYNVEKFTTYGDLAHKDLEGLQSGIRVAVSEDKKNPLDFALWKSAKPEEPFWDSPWGKGRPGWHIECSAMAKKYLGNTFDIHGGGCDLQFPHHQNELAQSEAANGSKFVNYWMHIGFVQSDKEKMSKSLGNFFTLKEILKKYHPEIIRYFVITSHYRSPVNFSKENLGNAHAALQKLYITLRDNPPDEKNNIETNSKFYKEFTLAMDDDFNTPKALSVLFELSREINQLHNQEKHLEAQKLSSLLKKLAWNLGILQDDPANFLNSGVNKKLVASLISQRNIARQNKDWTSADKIRDKLTQMGITLEDKTDGTSWVIEKKS